MGNAALGGVKAGLLNPAYQPARCGVVASEPSAAAPAQAAKLRPYASHAGVGDRSATVLGMADLSPTQPNRSDAAQRRLGQNVPCRLPSTSRRDKPMSD